jgi:hypothetical protein
MKSIIFDSGPMISMSMNNLLWLLPELKKKYNGKFYITPNVKREIIDNPMNSKKFKFESLQVLKQYKDHVLELFDKQTLKQKTDELLEIANNMYFAHNKNINIVQYAEMEVLIAAKMTGADAIVVDERTTRLLIENPEKLKKILQRKLHTSVRLDRNKLLTLKKLIKDIKVIRSTELIMVAYEKGLLNKYVLDIEEPKKKLVDGLLWALKLNGCSISSDEINKIVSLETK